MFTRADLEKKYGVTIGYAPCSDIAVHRGKTSKPYTEECGTRTGKQMGHDPEDQEHLQVHKRRRDAEPEFEGDRAVVREDEGDPTPLNSKMLRCRSPRLVQPRLSNSENEERARLRLLG